MQGRTLIFTACYNERENIGLLIDQVASVVPGADILVVDDSSPDGIWEVLQEKKREHPQLICVQRPSKLGIGSAHKYALFYALREGYKTVVTMDADFSHDRAPFLHFSQLTAPRPSSQGRATARAARAITPATAPS